MTKLELAEVVYTINKAYCESIGDFSFGPWETAEEWQINSCLDGIEKHLENPNLTPKESHDIWWTYKIREGWIWGAVKDPVKKTHPCMIPYDELPAEQRSKDYLFRACMHALIKYLR